MRFVLASASPARRRLLETAGIHPVVLPGSFDEESVPFADPDSYVRVLARGKAEDVLSRSALLPSEPYFLLACDSVLIFEGQVHGKPASPEQAVRRWKKMRGQEGQLFTGHYLLKSSGEKITAFRERVVCTKVFFASANDHEIEKYVATGEPLRCAGAFALEGQGGLFVERIDGCHSNVIGLSLPALRTMMIELGSGPTDFWK